MAQERAVAVVEEVPARTETDVSPAPTQRVAEQPATSSVRRPDPIGRSMAASTLIQTVVWSGVVIVCLVIGILLLLRYHIL